MATNKKSEPSDLLRDKEYISPAEAAGELKDSINRAWSDARETVRSVGDTWRRGARNVGKETRKTATATRETLGEALGDMGEISEEIAVDAIDLAKAAGIKVKRFVSKHPLRSLAIAAVAGVFLAQALRRHHND